MDFYSGFGDHSYPKSIHGREYVLRSGIRVGERIMSSQKDSQVLEQFWVVEVG